MFAVDVVPRNIYAIEEHTATAKFYPRENFPLYGISHAISTYILSPRFTI